MLIYIVERVISPTPIKILHQKNTTVLSSEIFHLENRKKITYSEKSFKFLLYNICSCFNGLLLSILMEKVINRLIREILEERVVSYFTII